jgi:threonine dehydrogenase-like Zn-dependent dehydrogenase
MAKSRAWVLTDVGKLEMQEFEIPKVEEDGALLKVDACGICGSDKHAFAGHMKAPFPFIPGHEFIGTIVEMGKAASQRMAIVGGPVKAGDQVAIAPSSLPCGRCWYCLHMPHRPSLCTTRSVYGFNTVKNVPGIWGGFGEYIYLHSKTWIFQLPKGIPPEKAVQAEPMSTGLRAVERAYNPGEAFVGQGYGVGSRAMVLGVGPIGLMVVVALRYSGADLIIAQDMLESRLAMAKRMGADLLIDGKLPFEERLKKVQEATEGVGPDVVIEAAGAPIAFQEAIRFARRGAKLIEVGHYTDPGAIDIHPWMICNKDLDLHGSWAYPPIIFKDALSILAKTPLPIGEVVTHKFPLEDLPKAMDLVGKEGVGKVVITP